MAVNLMLNQLILLPPRNNKQVHEDLNKIDCVLNFAVVYAEVLASQVLIHGSYFLTYGYVYDSLKYSKILAKVCVRR